MPLEARIDTHAHFLPLFYRNACLETGNGKADGMPALPVCPCFVQHCQLHESDIKVQEWSEESHLELMHDNSITKSIISISSPGVHLIPGDHALSRELARQCNDFAHDLIKRRPQEFGFWASLPLPDVEGSLEEISYALDDLHANGIAIETNYHGVYLGHPSLDRIFNELNKRKATVFIHPTTPCVKDPQSSRSDGHDHTAATPLSQFPSPLMEFLFHTTRSLINLFASGTVARCPDITFVIPHAGGVLPPLVQRFSAFATGIMHSEIDLSRSAMKKTLERQFYFDLAGFPFPDQIHGLLRFVGPEKLLYGSDYPFTPRPVVARLAESMSIGLEDVFPDELTRRGIYSGNARKLLSDD
jgi:predicted TIM-barrel fold metal-dependent hydrolase